MIVIHVERPVCLLVYSQPARLCITSSKRRHWQKNPNSSQPVTCRPYFVMPCSSSHDITKSIDSSGGATISSISSWLRCLPYRSCVGSDICIKCCSIAPGFCWTNLIFRLRMSRLEAGPSFLHDLGTKWRSFQCLGS